MFAVAAACLLFAVMLALRQETRRARDVRGYFAAWVFRRPGGTVVVGVRNEEVRPARYAVSVRVHGSAPRVFRLALVPGAEVESRLRVPRGSRGVVTVTSSASLGARRFRLAASSVVAEPRRRP